MKTGLDMVKIISYEEPGTKIVGHIIYVVPKNKKHIDLIVNRYDIKYCSWEEALEIKKELEGKINENMEVRILGVTFEMKERRS